MGFSGDLAERALWLTQEDVGLAAELLAQGKVSSGGLQEVVGVSDKAIFQRILQTPRLTEMALMGKDIPIGISARECTMERVVTSREVDDYVRATYGIDLQSFVQAGGARRFGPQPCAPAVRFQPGLDRKWLEIYETLSTREKAKVEALREITPDLALIVHVLVGCRGNVDDARQVLVQMR
jgi:hypothetical protein